MRNRIKGKTLTSTCLIEINPVFKKIQVYADMENTKYAANDKSVIENSLLMASSETLV